MKKAALKLVIMTGAFFLSIAPVFADEIQLVSGESMGGVIIEQDARELYFENTEGEIFNFQLEQIKSINGIPLSGEPVTEAHAQKSIVSPTREIVGVSPILKHQINAAYQAIPHKQTTFNPAKTELKVEEAKSLAAFFGLIDEAVVARVEALDWFRSHESRGRAYEDYVALVDDILARLKALEMPRKINKAKKLAYESIHDQKQYYAQWHSKNISGQKFSLAVSSPGWENHPKVSSSHAKLIQTYNEIMSVYSEENAQNKEAFFDHLCALDFV